MDVSLSRFLGQTVVLKNEIDRSRHLIKANAVAISALDTKQHDKIFNLLTDASFHTSDRLRQCSRAG